MIALALGLGVLGFCALRRARRRCYGGGYRSYGWHGPWGGGDYRGHYDDHDHDHPDDVGDFGPRFRGGWRGRGRRWMLHRALSRIDATPAQERAIVAEIEKLQERMRGARGGLKDGRSDLAAAIRNPVLDDAALGAVLGRVDGATGEARAAAVDALRNIHAVLDDKQRAEVAEMIDRGGGWSRRGPYR